MRVIWKFRQHIFLPVSSTCLLMIFISCWGVNVFTLYNSNIATDLNACIYRLFLSRLKSNSEKTMYMIVQHVHVPEHLCTKLFSKLNVDDGARDFATTPKMCRINAVKLFGSFRNQDTCHANTCICIKIIIFPLLF